MIETVTIRRLGHRGDGIADTPTGPLYVSGALPAETVTIERTAPDRARLLDIVEPSPERSAPPCPHFGACGGCVAQHMAEPLYRRWKLAILEGALAQQGLATDIRPLVVVSPASRRRVVLALARTPDGPVLGFHGARSHQVLAVPDCRVADRTVVAALPGLLALLAPFAPAKGSADVTLLATGAGLDVAVGAEPPASARTRQRLVDHGARLGLARLTIGAETIATWRPPAIDVGGVAVVPPAGGFVQAAAAAEEVLAKEGARIIGKARRVADLFAGSGAFTLRLARTAAVHAVESDAAALAALDTAKRGTSGLKPVTTERRDLFRAPLRAAELASFDAVVLNPPRQGAEAQARALATARVPVVAYASCNAASFARDARVLVDAGYRLECVTPVDQFLWSDHLEKIAAFRCEIRNAASGGVLRRR